MGLVGADSHATAASVYLPLAHRRIRLDLARETWLAGCVWMEAVSSMSVEQPFRKDLVSPDGFVIRVEASPRV